MTKSEFYKIWYSTRLPGQALNDHGYPNVVFKNTTITTEEEWEEFLQAEIDLAEFFKLSEEACKMAGVDYVKPYTQSRVYPEIEEQLDGIYKSLLAIKAAGVDLGAAGTDYLNSITAVKEKYPKN